MKRFLSLIMLLLLISGSASAKYDFQSNGLFYRITGKNPNTVTVTYERATSSNATYSNLVGDIVIPGTVNYNGTTYVVDAIDKETFSRCNDVTSFSIPRSVKRIGQRAFYNCQNCVVISIPEYSELRVVECYAFFNCKSLASVSLHNATKLDSIGFRNPSSWDNEGRVFGSCKKMTTVYLPNSITAAYMTEFYIDCSSLTTATIPSGVANNTLQRTFVNCTSLTHVTIPYGVTNLSGTFTNCTSMKSFTIPPQVTSLSDAFRGSGLTSITIPSTVTTVYNNNFQDCASLESVQIQNNLIGTAQFKNCTALKSVTIPASVTEVKSEAFMNCTALEKAVIQNDKIADSQFNGCSVLSDAPLENHITSIGNSAFASTALKSVTIPASVETIGTGVFENCTSLTSATIRNKTISNNQFAGTSLKSLSIGSQLESIGTNAFPATIETLDIDNNTFADIAYYSGSKSTIKTLTLGNAVTVLPENAFMGCSAMEKVTMPSTLTEIKNSAFSGCTKLMNVYALMPRPFAIDASVFNGVQQHGYCDLHVPKGSKIRYAAMDVWKEFTIILEDAEAPGKRGDLNGDDIVDVTDVAIVIDMVLGNKEPDLSKADLDNNGMIDVTDVSMVIDIVLGK